MLNDLLDEAAIAETNHFIIKISCMLFDCVWDTLQAFSHNDKQLKGTPSAIAVLHTHSRTFRYLDSKTKRYKIKTVPGTHFLWLVLQHVLPKGFRRARNYGFLHPNSKRLITLLKLTLHFFHPEHFQRKMKPRRKLSTNSRINSKMTKGYTGILIR